MALKMMRPGRSKEKRGAGRRMAFRFTRAGDSVKETRPAPLDSDEQMVELTYDDHGTVTTSSSTVPRP